MNIKQIFLFNISNLYLNIMKKRVVLAGAGSLMAKRLAELYSDQLELITLSRSENGFGENHLKVDILNDELPSMDSHLDGLVYFPGSINLKPFRSISIEDFLYDLEINLLGAVKVIKSYLKNLLKADSPGVILISSVAAGKGMAYHSSISASKGAVEGFTRAMAAEYAGKIRFNAVAPSLTDTPMAEKLLRTDAQREQLAANNPMNRIGSPSDIAEMIFFLLSDKASWVNGQVIHVDGGLSTLSTK